MTDSANNPLVSIIVRTKDRPKLLNRALESIAAQTYRPIEVVLVNDGGCDLDVEELKTILGDVFLNYQRIEKNRGRAHAGNVGIENAKGKYVGFLDDDDEFLASHISDLVLLLERPDYEVVYSDSLMVYKEYNLETCEFTDTAQELLFSQDFDYDFLIFENYIPFMCLLFSKEVLLEAGGIDESLELYEDWDLLIRIGERYPFLHRKEVTAYYNQWDEALQISQGNRDFHFLEQAYLQVLSKHMDKITATRIRNYIQHHVDARRRLTELNRYLEFIEKGQNIEEIISSRERKLKSLDSVIKEKDATIEKLNAAVAQLGAAVEDGEARVGELEAAIRDQNVQQSQLEAILNRIYSSHGWKALTSYYRLRDQIFPAQSRRRYAAKRIWSWLNKLASAALLISERVEKSLSYIRSYGIKAFVRKVRGKFAVRASSHKPSVPILKLPEVGEDGITAYEDASISVVIPTKNAGSDFELLMAMIKEQKGLKDIEIVVVDSGSSDETIETAKAYGASIIDISSEKFSHSYSRNIGAEHSRGNYLFFTVQDALIPSKRFLYDLVHILRNNVVAAVSCAEFPREDIDLFYSVLLWNHYKFLGVDKDDRILSLPDAETHISLRKNGQISDLACLMSKDVFMRYKYRFDYAEDLDLGVRLIKDGHKLALLNSIRIIHSHNRTPYYFLKRGYVDILFLAKLFSDYPVPAVQWQPVLNGILAYPAISYYLREAFARIKTPITVEMLFDVMGKKLDSFAYDKHPSFTDYQDCPYFEEGFRSFLKKVSAIRHVPEKHAFNGTMLKNAVLGHIMSAKDYMTSTYEVIDDVVLEDFKALVLKAYALQCGVHLAFCHLNDSSIIGELQTELKGGI